MVAVTRTGRWLPTLARLTGRAVRNEQAAANAKLARLVAAKLDDDWSPQQIAQWLRREHPGDAGMWVSHESIYRDVYMPSRKVFPASMFHRLRSNRPDPATAGQAL
jgi:IS30 family transposase